MTTPTPDQVLAGYQAASGEVRRRVLAYAASLWSSLPAYRDAQAEMLIDRLVPQVLAGQVQIANLTSAYLGAQMGVPPISVDRDAVTGGRGVDPDQVYARPFEQIWGGLAGGGNLDALAIAAGQRLAQLIATDLQMAKVRQSDASLRAGGGTYYRRVLRGRKNCALCVIASTQRYHVGNLQPIHPGCDCDVAPLRGDYEFERVIDPKLLEDAHGAVKQVAGVADRGGRAPDYRKLLLVREHGEIGNVLTWRHQQFTSLDDIPAYKSSPRRR